MVNCPVCNNRKIWRYGVRQGRRGQMRRLLCKECGHLWEILEETTNQEPINSNKVRKGGRVPPKLKDYFNELMVQMIDDVERDIPLEKAGWCTFNPEIRKKLIQIGFCESENDEIRLILSKPLPRNLVRTDAGDIIFDIQKAIELTQSLSTISENQDLQRGAKFAGLIRMLQTSDFPVLAYIVFKEGLNPDIWFTKAPQSAYELASEIAEKLWGFEKAETALMTLTQSDFPVPEKQNSEITEKVKKILNWKIITDVFGPDIFEALGFTWYSDLLVITKKIKYLEGISLIQKKVSNNIEVMMGRSLEELSKELHESTIEMEDRSKIANEEEKNQVAAWHEIIRFPW